MPRRFKGKLPAEQQPIEDKENEHPSAAERTSKFKEGTMNSTSAIVAPPDELWKGLDMEQMIERFNEETTAPAFSAATTTNNTRLKRPAPGSRSTSASHSSKGTLEPATATTNESPFGRLSRAVANWFSAASLSSLGKRKAGSDTAEKNATDKMPDDRQRFAEEYQRMKEQGLFSKPIVLARPTSRIGKTHASLASSVPTTPTTPALYKTPSKHDLHKQKQLSKRVSNLEHKLKEARRELSLVLSPQNPHSVPPLPTPLTPKTIQRTPSLVAFFSGGAAETSPDGHDDVPNKPTTTAPCPDTAAKAVKIVKKRKTISSTVAEDDDGAYKPVPTDSDHSLDYDYDSVSSSKKAKLTPAKKLTRKTSRSARKRSGSGTLQSVRREEVVVTVVPDGDKVPMVPDIPVGVRGRRVEVRGDDGYGGFEHEMF